MTEIVLLRPLWLLGLLLVVALGIWVARRPATLGAWRAAIDPTLMHAMAEIGRIPPMRNGRRILLPLVGASITALALSGPAIERRDAPAFRNLDGVVLVMDLSNSVTQDGHLPALSTAARVVLASLGSRPAALIVYAGDAYLAAPLTTDTTQIGLTVSLLKEGMIKDLGSRPELALERAAALLKGAEIIAGDVILFTDLITLNSATVSSADAIDALGAKLWVVTPDGTLPEAESLTARADGQTFKAQDATTLMQALGNGRKERLARSEIELIYKADLGRYLLIPALIVLCFSFRKGA